MREISFRGKRADSGRWIYGYLCRVVDDRKTKMGIQHAGFLATRIAVDDKTVGQYTGLKDKNGVKIFEGDIMMFYTGTKGVVIYSKQGFVWQGYPQDQHNPMGWFGGKWQEHFEVIGNIHDNPELLEVE